MTLDTANMSAMLSTIVDPQVKSMFEKIVNELTGNTEGDTTLEGRVDTAESDIGTVEGRVDGNDALLLKVLLGDFALKCDPVALGSSAATVNTDIAGDGFSRTVTCSVVDGDDAVVTEFNGTLPISIGSVTNGDGVADIDSATTVTLVDGVGTVTINYTGTWAADDTCTLTFGSSSAIAGKSVADKTSVDTLVA